MSEGGASVTDEFWKKKVGEIAKILVKSGSNRCSKRVLRLNYTVYGL